MIQITFKLAFLAAATLAAPAAEAEADAQFLLGGHHGLGYGHLGYAAHVIAAPICQIVHEEVVVGKQCHAEPDCTTSDVVVGQTVTGHKAPVCTDVETVVPALAHGYYGKREAEADAQVLIGHHGLGYLGHAAVTTVTTKHCAAPVPIIEDITHPVTRCLPKEVCVDVKAVVPKTVCGEAAAPAAEAAVEVVEE